MQVGMILGLLASYPANRWLIRHGIKEGMRPRPAGNPTRAQPGLCFLAGEPHERCPLSRKSSTAGPRHLVETKSNATT